jgi:hypothetical protein
MIDLGSPAILATCAVFGGAALALAAVRLVRRVPAIAHGASDARERERRARDLGWTYDETAAGGTVFTFRGESDGVKWKVRFRIDDTHPEKRASLTWASPSVLGSATELRLIGRARYERGKAHGEAVLERLSTLVLSPRDIATAQARAEFIERTPPVEVGSAAFRSRFVVIARNRRLARALIDAHVEQMLMAWPGRPPARPDEVLSAWLDWQGLRIDVDTHWTGMQDIEHLVAIGLAVAREYRRHAAAPGVTRWMSTEPGHVT